MKPATLRFLLAALVSGASLSPAIAADGVRSVTLSSGRLAEVTRSVSVDAAPNDVPTADGGTERAGVAQGRAARAFEAMLAPPASGAATDMAVAEPAPKMSSAANPGTATEGDVTATYRLPAPVDLPSARTLSMPIVDAVVDAERVSVFQPQSGDKHPVAAMMLRNKTGASLPPGILTVYDSQDGYVGDARLIGIPVGDERMVSFATDAKVEVIAEERPEEDVVRAAVEGGVATISNRSRATTTYEVRGAPDGKRTIVVEHPKREGWEFRSDALRGTTATARRLAVEVPAGETKVVTAVDEIVRREGYALAVG